MDHPWIKGQESECSSSCRASKLSKAELAAQPSRASQTFSKAEAEKLLSKLRTADDPLFAHVAPVLAAGVEPTASVPVEVAAQPGVGSAQQPAKAKTSTFAAFKRKLLPKLRKSGSNGQLRTVPSTSNELPPGTLGQGYSPGNYDHFAAEAGDSHRHQSPCPTQFTMVSSCRI